MHLSMKGENHHREREGSRRAGYLLEKGQSRVLIKEINNKEKEREQPRS